MPTKWIFLKRLRNLGADQSGAIAVIAAIALVAFLGFAALVLDLGHIAIVKSELQKAADAGALAGAKALGSASSPNWSSGVATATYTVAKNSAAGALLTDCTPTYGYWSTLTHTLQPSTITPQSTDMPAIKVVVAKTAGENGGPLQLSFAPILGINTTNLDGAAVAIITPSSSTSGGGGWGILEIGDGNVNISGYVPLYGNVGMNGNGNINISGSSGITGNLWVNGNGGIDLSGTGYVTGSLWDNGTGVVSMSGSASVGGTAYLGSPANDSFSWSTSINGQTAQNNGSNGFINTGAASTDASGAVGSVQPYAQQALTAYNDFSALPATSAVTVINNTANWNEPVRTIYSTGDQTVVNLTSLTIGGDGNLTLNGSSTDTFIINVAGNFSISGSGGIFLSGGLTADNVTFVHQGTSTVSVGGSTTINGTILSPNGAINISGNSTYNGSLISGQNVTLSGSVHSPQNLPWLVPGSGGSGTTGGVVHLVQ